MFNADTAIEWKLSWNVSRDTTYIYMTFTYAITHYNWLLKALLRQGPSRYMFLLVFFLLQTCKQNTTFKFSLKILGIRIAVASTRWKIVQTVGILLSWEIAPNTMRTNAIYARNIKRHSICSLFTNKMAFVDHFR